MEFAFLSLFIINCIVHLFFRIYKNDIGKNLTKGLIVPLALGFYIALTKEINPIVVIAFACSWIGDILLMIKSTAVFCVGGLFFGATQILLTISYAQKIDFASLSPSILILIPLIYSVSLMLLFFLSINKSIEHKILKPCLSLYLLGNGAMNTFALYLLIYNPNWMTIVLFIGATIFLTSDIILCYTRFKKASYFYNKHFATMLTYILAVILILWAMAFI